MDDCSDAARGRLKSNLGILTSFVAHPWQKQARIGHSLVGGLGKILQAQNGKGWAARQTGPFGLRSTVSGFQQQSFYRMEKVLSVFGFVRKHIALDQLRRSAFV
jgi:hypothetical protein